MSVQFLFLKFVNYANLSIAGSCETIASEYVQ